MSSCTFNYYYKVFRNQKDIFKFTKPLCSCSIKLMEDMDSYDLTTSYMLINDILTKDVCKKNISFEDLLILYENKFKLMEILKNKK